MAIDLVLIASLLLLAACFEGAETAFLSISDVRVQTLVQKKDRRGLLLEELKSNTRTMLGALLLGQTVCDIAAAAIATMMATTLFGDLGVGIVTGVLTTIVLIFVNLIPKTHAARNPERWSLFFVVPAHYLITILGPLVALIDRFVGLFVRGTSDAALVSEEEIKTMAFMGVKTGAIEHGEKELIERVFLFNDITAEDVMTPRINMFLLDGKKTVAEVLPNINVSKYSRFPVYENDKGNIVGVIHIKDILEKVFLGETAPSELLVKDVALPATFVPETKLIDDLFRDFQKNHVHMAIVVNEYGSVVGLVTLEDLIEELVGEISDESDIDEHVIKRVDKYNVLAHGDVEVQHINRFFNVKIDAPEHKNISWVIHEKLGSVPTEGQTVTIDNTTTAAIEKMENRRIIKVRLTKKLE